MAIKRVWVEPGCISCGLSSRTCPEVFELPEDFSGARIRENADLSKNEAKIRQVAATCPAEVVKFEEG